MRRLLTDDRAESDAVVALPAVVAVMVVLAVSVGVVVWWAAAQSAQAIANAAGFEALSLPVLGTPAAESALGAMVAAEAAARSFPPLSCALSGLDVAAAQIPASVTVTVTCSTTVPVLGFVHFERSVTLGLNPSHLIAGSTP